MKMPAFTALALTASMMMASGMAFADGPNDGGPQAPQTAEQKAQADANAQALKEGAGKAFSFFKAVGGLAVDGVKDAGAAVKAKADQAQAAIAAKQAEQAQQAAPAAPVVDAAPQKPLTAQQQRIADAKARADAQAGGASAPSPTLAQTASGMVNSQGGKAVMGMVGHFIPGGATVANVGSKALEAKAKADAKAASAPAQDAPVQTASQKPDTVAGAAPSITPPAPVKAIMSFGSGLLDKINARRDANAAADAASAPAPVQQNKL